MVNGERDPSLGECGVRTLSQFLAPGREQLLHVEAQVPPLQTSRNISLPYFYTDLFHHMYHFSTDELLSEQAR